MKTLDICFIAVVMTVFALPLQAEPLTVPNTFTAGTTALAAEVNANFAAIETAVDDNDLRITDNDNRVTSNISLIGQNTTTISSKQDRVSGNCPAGQSIRVINPDGTVSCESDNDTNTTYSAGSGLNLSGTTFSVDPAETQNRVTQGCAAGFSIRVINLDGTVSCESDNDTNTTYSAGSGLNLSGTTFSVDPAETQNRVTQACGAGSSIRQINQNGTVSCEQDTDTNTTYSAGSGLSLSGTTFSAPGMPGADMSSASGLITLSTTAKIIRQVIFVAPTSGLVFLSASGRFRLSTTSNTSPNLRLNLSPSSSLTITQSAPSYRVHEWPGGLGGFFSGSFHSQDLITVTAGAKVFFLLADSPAAIPGLGTNAHLENVTLTALFVPQRL
ncbi:MAG: hypothetical protein GY727_14750 [Gammaproteobacteria bacterium]|nr:hypothetical protein [Gammaproteobacteria bacterium]